MPGIAIQIDGTHLATVNFAGMQMADVSVHSGLDNESPAAPGRDRQLSRG